MRGICIGHMDAGTTAGTTHGELWVRCPRCGNLTNLYWGLQHCPYCGGLLPYTLRGRELNIDP